MSLKATQLSNQNITCWNTTACNQIKQGSAITLAALAAIALCVGVLFIMAKQGLPLGGLNAAAHAISPAGLYIGTALAVVITALSAAYAIYMRNPDALETPVLQQPPGQEAIPSSQKAITEIVAPPRIVVAATENPALIENTDVLRQEVAKNYPGPALEVNEYWTYESQYKDGAPLYAIAFADSPTEIFANPEARKAYIDTLGEGAIDLKASFETPQYTEKEVVRLRGKDSTQLERICEDVNEGCYRTCEVMTLGKKRELYVVSVRGHDQTHTFYFKTKEKRQDHIETFFKQQDLIDEIELEKATSNSSEQVGWSDCKKYCPQIDDYWSFETTVTGQKLFVIIVHDGPNWEYCRVYRSDKERFEKYISKVSSNKNGFARKLIDDHSVEEKLKGPNAHCRVVSGECVYLFYKREGTICWQVVLPETLKKITDTEYPEALVVGAAPQYSLTTLKKVGAPALFYSLNQLRQHEGRLLIKNEYCILDPVKTHNPFYPEFYPLWVKDRDGVYSSHYFKSENARKGFCTENKLKDANARNKEELELVRIIGPYYYNRQTSEKKPLLFVFPGSHFVTFDSKDTKGEHPIDVEKSLKGMENSYLRITNQDLIDHPIDQEATHALQEVFLSDYKKRLPKEKSYVVYHIACNYPLICVRHPDRVSKRAADKLQFETFFKFTHRTKIDELVKLGYQEVAAANSRA